MRWYDLHTHTTASDGMNPPAYNVRLAKEEGLTGIAITDHDTVAGLAEAEAEGARIGVIVVPGVEISTQSEGRDIHVLGYFINTRDEILHKRLSDLRRTRELRNEMMIARLNELGMPITLEEVIAQADKSRRKDETVGRPHIASVMVAKGYVASIGEAFDRYLGSEGEAYVNPPRIRPEDAIRWIREAGGAPVLAHPGLYQNDELVVRLIESGGLAGIEASHADHTEEDEARYKELARCFGLIATGGSDFHGKRGEELFHAMLGGRRVEEDIVTLLREEAGK